MIAERWWVERSGRRNYKVAASPLDIDQFPSAIITVLNQQSTFNLSTQSRSTQPSSRQVFRSSKATAFLV